ncbi:subtilisin family serine protease [Krasilnikovia cinnamomea]|uniref:Subtilisin family serine protease n=1 Tax=Krasilnikovia cinnamomea TaxID=349313 RepID=A0A4Q7ZJQ3_9ACTN|nr:S8 family serine peptidase [Krasilnikovia cinnamomea]RZU51128.1 subtilisin family serine protease [Krasilnikovia cinnamomea]
MRIYRTGTALLVSALAWGIGAAAPAASADPGAVRLVVGFRSGDGLEGSAHRLAAAGLRLKGTQRLAAKLRARTLTVPAGDAARIKARLQADGNVAFVEVSRKFSKLDVTPDDPRFTGQSELGQIHVPAAWETTTGAAGTVVAVVDTGVTPVGDLAGATLPGWDFANNDADPSDDEGHGSEVASVIAARGNNGAGIAGVCWQCRILPVKVLDHKGEGFDDNIADGIVYAADHGAKVINLSLGAPGGASRLLQMATDYARAKGAVVIAAAGNDALPEINYPAGNAGVLAVGGTDAAGNRFVVNVPEAGDVGSNYGASWVDVAAPFCTTAQTRTGGYDTFCGTSASTPLVSGVAALVKSHDPAANLWSVERALTSTAQPLSDNWLRYGEVRADRAVRLPVDHTAPTVGGATPANKTKFRGTVTVSATSVSDNAGGSGVDHASLYADGKFVGADYSAPFSVKYRSGSRNGTVKLQWKVFDRAGNAATYNRNLVADNLAPTLKWKSGPANNKKVRGKVTVKASASDAGSGILRVELWINGKLAKSDAKAGYSFVVNTAKYGKKIKVQLRARDKVGNLRSSSTRTWKR